MGGFSRVGMPFVAAGVLRRRRWHPRGSLRRNGTAAASESVDRDRPSARRSGSVYRL